MRASPSDRDAISYIPENYDPLVESGQMTLLKGGEEIVPGISVRTFPGHTANMQAIIVQSPSGAKSPPSSDLTARLKPRPFGAPFILTAPVRINAANGLLYFRSDADDGAH